MRRTLTLFAIACLVTLTSGRAFAAQSTLCAPFADVIDRPSVTDNPCALGALDPGTVALETGYYQNASAVGGTQLAAYPEARVRYAALSNAEIFLDAPNEIAFAGPSWRHGVYTDQPGGIGTKVTMFESARVAYAASFEYGPPNPAYSEIEARSRYAASLDAGLLLAPQWRLTGTLRFVDGHRYASTQPGDLGLEEALSAAYDVDTLTRAGIESSTESGSRRDRARAQSLGDAFLERDLSKRVIFDTNIGTTFDAVKHTKPHYLGTGLSYRI